MRFAFTKCHGSGNDFPMIDARGLTLSDGRWAAVARALADRGGPVGGDGLLLLTDGRGGRPFGMRMFNSDGSEAELCLNGLRCVARAGFAACGVEVADVSLARSDAWTERDDDVSPGVYTVATTAGPVALDVREWPMRVGADRIVDAVVPPLGERRFTAVAMPNPHLVAFVDAIDEAELVRVGETCEAAPDWLPRRANVSFVEVGDGGGGHARTLFVRTFERGVGLTDSCGSAMAASTYAACLTGRIEFGATVTVLNRGGMVRGIADDEGMVTISGNATFEWTGEVEIDPENGVAHDLTVLRRHPEEVAAWGAVAERARTYR